MKLNIPEELFNRRMERMVELIQTNAPRIIIYNEARLLREALENPVKYKFRIFFRNIYYWWLALQMDDLEILPEEPLPSNTTVKKSEVV